VNSYNTTPNDVLTLQNGDKLRLISSTRGAETCWAWAELTRGDEKLIGALPCASIIVCFRCCCFVL
jgi:hypothetical protein